ncbi:MAG: glycosyltransferase family 4 protein [Candidatus Omnitrophica bacterium]|nr:glycosyltransferase family 4 protein [Candidatus Omnitrophota bacterium]
MKILLLTTHINIGGVGLYLLNLAKGLKKRGVKCFVASSGGNLERYFKTARISLVNLDIKTKFEFNPKLIPGIFKLIRFVKKNDIDIIHAHTRVTQVLGRLISKFTTLKRRTSLTGQAKPHFVTTCHGFFKSERLSRRLFPCWGEATIAISQAVKTHLINDFNLPENRISLIYNGIDLEEPSKVLTEEEKELLKENLRLGKGPVIGSIGRLSPVKGYKYLLFAMKDLKNVIPDVKLLIIGEGPSGNKLRDLSKKLNLEDSVSFVKATLDVRRFLTLMDIFVFPSIQEGLGLSLIEAMASGKVCIATSIGGISSVIEDGKNGLLVQPGDSHSLTEAMRRLLLDKELFSRLGSAARNSVKNKFSLDRMMEETIRFYESVKDRD